jgi:hypothetical protein
MGQATLDLPDPTQLSGGSAGPLSPEALASADDLLSQLAGDDIDRLLAEADAERPAIAELPPQPQPQFQPPPPDAPLQLAPQATLASEPSPPSSAAAEVVAPAIGSPPTENLAEDEAATAAAIDAILGPAIESTVQAVEKQTDMAEPAAASPEPAHSTDAVGTKVLDDAAAHVASIMDVPTADPPPAAAANAAERQALSEPLILPQAAATSPNYLWPLVTVLELINSPMDFFSDEVREAMGKVAIVTTLNAAAVLVYVMVFRRPHH